MSRQAAQLATQAGGEGRGRGGRTACSAAERAQVPPEATPREAKQAPVVVGEGASDEVAQRRTIVLVGSAEARVLDIPGAPCDRRKGLWPKRCKNGASRKLHEIRRSGRWPAAAHGPCRPVWPAVPRTTRPDAAPRENGMLRWRRRCHMLSLLGLYVLHILQIQERRPRHDPSLRAGG